MNMAETLIDSSLARGESLWDQGDLVRRLCHVLDTAARVISTLAPDGYVDAEETDNSVRPEKVISETAFLLPSPPPKSSFHRRVPQRYTRAGGECGESIDSFRQKRAHCAWNVSSPRPEHGLCSGACVPESARLCRTRPSMSCFDRRLLRKLVTERSGYLTVVLRWIGLYAPGTAQGIGYPFPEPHIHPF